MSSKQLRARQRVSTVISSLQPAQRRLAMALRGALAVYGAAALLSTPQVVHAQEAQAVQAYNIAAGDLDLVLTQFANAADLQLTVPAALTKGKQSTGLSGRFTVAQGFATILDGQHLVAERNAGGAWLIVAAPTMTSGQLPQVAVLGTAESESRQALGASTITAEDIEKRPPVNDLAEIIRTQPGINLTGNSTSGQRGNNRQIDIRGMGPENTLILVDGKPVTSRNSVRYGWAGERDTRGDTNWVPASEVDRVEVIRGPAAARYGSGAMGGVVNIITKPPTDAWHGSVTLFADQPQHSVDGATQRTSFDISGPLSEHFAVRLYGNVNKTDSDAYDINQGHTTPRSGTQAGTYPAGREGVRNRDLSGRVTWKLTRDQSIDFDASFSRQGNIYSGDTQNTNNFTTTTGGALATTSARVAKYLGTETNIMFRNNYSATYNGKFDFGSVKAYLQYAKTRNERLEEGLSGGVAGLFSSDVFSTSVLEDYTAHLETSMPLKTAGFSHVLTIGTEWTRSDFSDPNSVTQTTTTGGSVGTLTSSGRSDRMSSRIASVFVEDNLALSDNTIITPALRLDDHSTTGANWSPSLNVSHSFAPNWTVKTGIARAYKAPNLYQLNPNYLLYSSGNGCWGTSTACYLMGNSSLKGETSVNKEIGIEYKRDNLQAGLTFFRNDYRNKIEAGLSPVGTATGGLGANIYQWTNIPQALVQGLEGNFKLSLSDDIDWSNNVTYMITSENKQTGEQLSIIPKYTLNSTVDWKINDAFSSQATLTWYGKQEPKKYDYQGNLVSGYAAQSRSPYALVGLSGKYKVNKSLSIGFGVRNIFDKRLYREGNSSGTSNGANVISGAGAATYNEPGRSFWTSLTASF